MADIATIDGAGRIVVPKRLRVRLGLSQGARLRIHEDGERLVLEPIPEDAETIDEHGLLVIRGAMAGELVDHREQRAERGRRIAGGSQ